jgi:hypothetical protein
MVPCEGVEAQNFRCYLMNGVGLRGSLRKGLPMKWPRYSSDLQWYGMMFYLVRSHINPSQDGVPQPNADSNRKLWRFHDKNFKITDLHLVELKQVKMDTFQLQISWKLT